jgi:hypothetical protein
MLVSFKHFLSKNLKPLFVIFLIYTLLKIIATSLFEGSLLIIILYCYLLVGFVENTKIAIFDNASIGTFGYIKIKGKQIILDYFILFVFILVLYYLLSIPFLLYELSGSNFIESNQSIKTNDFSLIIWLVEGFFKAIYQCIFIYSLSSMAVDRCGVSGSLKNGFGVFSRTKYLFVTIIILNCFFHLFESLITQKYVLELVGFVWTLIFPTAILFVLLFLYIEKFKDHKLT